MNNPFRIDLPFYHPSSILMLDDDKEFLLSMRAALGDTHAICLYSDVSAALERLKQVERDNAEYFQIAGSYYEPLPEGTNVPSSDFSDAPLTVPVVQNINYDLVSVVIVDEVMPTMRGLDFCNKIKNSGTKIILLTGQADNPEKTIEAFNNGIIHKFISKGDPQALEKIKRAISELNGIFFETQCNKFNLRPHLNNESEVEPSQIAQVMDNVFSIFPFTEYFHNQTTGGYLLRDAKGESKLAFFTSQKSSNDVALFIDELACAKSQAVALREGTHILPWVFLDDKPNISISDVEKRMLPANRTKNTLWSLINYKDVPSCIEKTNQSHTIGWNNYIGQVQFRPVNMHDDN